MHTLPSSEFRKRFASLTEDTYVTVNGHEIGMWVPVRRPRVLVDVTAATEPVQVPKGAHIVTAGLSAGGGGSFTEFRPVPKPSQKVK